MTGLATAPTDGLWCGAVASVTRPLMTVLDATVPAAQAGLAAPVAGSVRFVGQARFFWQLLVRGGVLLMFTLGIYRFWLDHRHPAFPVVQHRAFGRDVRIQRHCARAVARLHDRDRDPGLDLCRLLRHHLERGADRRVVRAAQPCAVRPARPIRHLSGAPLSPHPHGLSRRPVPSDRRGVALCGLRRILVGHDDLDPRPRLSVRAIAARALQDAQHLLRQSARPFRRHRLAAVRARRPDVVSGGRADDGRRAGDDRRRRLGHALENRPQRRPFQLDRHIAAWANGGFCGGDPDLDGTFDRHPLSHLPGHAAALVGVGGCGSAKWR